MIRWRRTLLLFLVLLMFCGVAGTVLQACEDPADAGTFRFQKIAAWRDDATAAYTIIHDDLCRPALSGIQEIALPELNKRKLTVGLGAFASACESAGAWEMLAEAESMGHEIVNHSYQHVEVTTDNAAREVHQAKKELERHLEQPVTFYTFPFDSFTADTVEAVRRAGHLGARAGNPGNKDGFDNPPINPAEPTNDMAVEFDVWPRVLSKYGLYHDILATHVYNAIDRGGWALREFHSVSAEDIPPRDGTEGFEPVSLKEYRDHLDFLVQAQEANKIWVSPPTTIIRYRHASRACGAEVDGSTIRFDVDHPDCRRFATPISVIVATERDVASLVASQDGEPVPTRKLEAGVFSVTADATRGEVEMSGCNDPGPQVRRDATLPPKPSPAASACDLEWVTGSGAPGRMDDMRRLEADLQASPNPRQEDGRNGNWSWYPQDAAAEIVRHERNEVLRFAGRGLDQWAGLRLAFLGSGVGNCYDASSYRGVRFRVRGLVVGGEHAGKVFVGAATAETQSRRHGGDLRGEGGHFYKLVDVASQWTTIAIEWNEFEPPAWGDTASLTRLAVDKLQVLEFGVADTAFEFVIYLDDIELY